MFTGIVQHVGVVDWVAAGSVRKLAVRLGPLAADLGPGASVAVNGTCLTVAEVAAGSGTAAFDVVAETLAATNLGSLAPGDRVNVERSFRVGDEVGGHILSGHTSATVAVTALARAPGHCRLTVRAPPAWMPYLMPKGFVALNGTSLTIQALDRSRRTFAVTLIPETLARTTFDATAVGDRLNLEVDAQTQAVVETVRSVLPGLLAEQPGAAADPSASATAPSAAAAPLAAAAAAL